MVGERVALSRFIVGQSISLVYLQKLAKIGRFFLIFRTWMLFVGYFYFFISLSIFSVKREKIGETGRIDETV